MATFWQKKSDSPYQIENTDNQNNTCLIAKAKLFKLRMKQEELNIPNEELLNKLNLMTDVKLKWSGHCINLR